ncbi:MULTISPECIES: tape measure protein [unclassified Sphingobacterium]|uniref:tape measure protein n=1 Tax=unclassified Sphingobacterium TaxID=2609468 RepID=UPI0020C1D041|nr:MULTISPECIES: tape measure protein [unclassified Sphingobacterium]
MADAVLSVEIRAKLDQLSKGLSVAEKSIEDFVNRGDRHISAIEQRFDKMGKSTKEIAENIKNSFGGVSLDKYFQSINNGTSVIDHAKEGVAKYKSEVERLKAVSVDLSNQIKEKTKALNESKNATEQAKTATEKQRKATESERTELQRLKKELAALTLEKRKNQQATTAASGSYREAQQRLTALGKSIRENANGFNLKNKAVRAQIAEYTKLNSKLKEFDRAMGNHQRNVGNYTSAISGAIPYLTEFTTAAGIVALAVSGMRESFNTNLKLDALNVSLREVSGSSIAFDTNLKFLRETADRLGLDFMSTAQSFKTWQGSAKFANLTGSESRKIFESVANAAGRLKLSNEQVQGTFLAMSQMMSKGKVQAEELRGQLGERLPGAFALAAKAMGVTEAQLNKMLEKGQVISEDFLPKFAKQLDISFGNDKTEKIVSMQASVNRLNTAFDMLWDSKRAKTFFTEVTDGFAEMIREITILLNSQDFSAFWKRFWDKNYTDQRGMSTGEKYIQNFGISGKSLNEQKKNIGELGILLKKAREKYNNFYKTSASDGLSVNQAMAKYDELGRSVNYYIAALSEAIKVYRSQGGMDVVKKSGTTPGGSDSDAKKAQREREKLAKDIAREQELLEKTLLNSYDSLNKREVSGIQKTIEEINQKYEGWKRNIYENVKISSNASEAIKQLEINNKAETILAIDKMVKKSLSDQEKKTKDTAIKIADATKKIAQDNINVDLVFSRKFDESASQRSLRILNSEYKNLAADLEKSLRGQVSIGVTNIDADGRQDKLQKEYFDKAEQIYKEEQRMRLAMVDSRGLFNKALEKSNILLDENVRKFQAGAISVEQFKAVQDSLLNQQDSINALKTVYDQFSSGVGDAFSNMLVEGQSFKSGMESLFKSLVSSLIQQFSRLAAIKLFSAIFTGGASTAISTILPGVGFSSGGYTGNMSPNKPAGIVHGKEFVFDAESTKRIGVDNLRSLQSGEIPSINDFTPRVAKNFSNSSQNNSFMGKNRLSLDLNIEGQTRNNVTKWSYNKATRFEKKFGKG